MIGATKGFVEFALRNTAVLFPAKARAMATDAITDLLGCMIAGSGEPLAKMLGGIVFDVPTNYGAPLAADAAKAKVRV